MTNGTPEVRAANHGESPPDIDQRSRILDLALNLLAERGVAGMSMRRLASACDLNVATLYHYFGGKEELVRAAVERGAAVGLASARPELRLDADVETRLAALLGQLAEEMLANDDLWRVLIAEALHGDPDVLDTVLAISDAFDATLTEWLAELAPDAPALSEPEVVGSLRRAVYGLLVLELVQPETRTAEVKRQTRAMASVFARLAQPN